MKPTKVWPTIASAMTSSWIEYQPRGRSLIIAPWNFPLNLCFGPMVSALAAGDTVILKPSEHAVSAVMAEIISSIFPDNEVALFEGSLPTSQALLDLPFDDIFFTGSPAVGKVVMAAAAKNLTSRAGIGRQVARRVGQPAPDGRSPDVGQVHQLVGKSAWRLTTFTCTSPSKTSWSSSARLCWPNVMA